MEKGEQRERDGPLRYSTKPSCSSAAIAIVLYLCVATCIQHKCKHFDEANNTKQNLSTHMCVLLLL